LYFKRPLSSNPQRPPWAQQGASPTR
jgi:hypothetical protein